MLTNRLPGESPPRGAGYHRPMDSHPGPMRHSVPLWVQIAFGFALLLLCWWPALDAAAEARIDASLKRALAAFAIARGIDAVISAAQGTELALQPAGVGLTLSPGELLDPVNDLVERFSGIMLMASASLGLQKLLLNVSGWTPLWIVLSIAIAAYLLLRMDGRRGALVGLDWLRPLLLVLLIVRFAVPLSALASEAAYRAFLADEYEQASALLKSEGEAIGKAAKGEDHAVPPPPATRPTQPAAPPTLLERTRQWFGDAREAIVNKVDVRAALERKMQHLKEIASEMTEKIIELIAIFIIQTLVFPLLFLWLSWQALQVGLPALWRQAASAPRSTAREAMPTLEGPRG